MFRTNKLVNKRVSVNRNAYLDSELEDDFLEAENEKADEIRQKYYEHEKKENPRGLIHRKHHFDKTFMPVLFEEIIAKGSLEKNSEDDETQEEEEKTPSRRKSNAKKEKKGNKHYFFLMHGYASSSDDMEFFKACITQKLNNAVVH